MKICRHYLVSGRVQGVNYRVSAREAARSFELTGWVRNLPDGRVELVACGEEVQIEKLQDWLFKGPRGARVDGVAFESMPWLDFNGFDVSR